MTKLSQSAVDLIRQEPSLLRRHLLIDMSGKVVRLADVMKPWQRRDFEALDESWRRAIGLQARGRVYSLGWLGRGRGCSKTSDAAIMATTAVYSAPRSIVGVAAAGSKDQARLIIRQIRKLLELNPWLRSVLKLERNRLINKQTGAELAVISADANSSWGLLVDFVIIDELTNWPDAGEELWHSLFSASAKRENCLLLVLSNSGLLDSWGHRVFTSIASNPDCYSSETNEYQTLLSEGQLALQRKTLPRLVYQRLFNNRWTPATGDALDESALRQCIQEYSYPMRGNETGYAHVLGVDIGVKRDFSAVSCIACHPATNKIRLAWAKRWKPPKGGEVDLSVVAATIGALRQRYNPVATFADPTEARWMLQRMRRMGMHVVEQNFSGAAAAKMASCLLTAVNCGQLELPVADPSMADDLRGLSIKQAAGIYRIVADRTANRGHCDLAMSLLCAIGGALEICGRGFNGDIAVPTAHESPMPQTLPRGIQLQLGPERRRLAEIIAPAGSRFGRARGSGFEQHFGMFPPSVMITFHKGVSP